MIPSETQRSTFTPRTRRKPTAATHLTSYRSHRTSAQANPNLPRHKPPNRPPSLINNQKMLSATITPRLLPLRSLLPTQHSSAVSRISTFFTAAFAPQTRPGLANTLAMRRRATVGMVGGLAQQQQQVRGMKVRSSVKKLCDGCKVRSLYFFRFSPPISLGSFLRA